MLSTKPKISELIVDLRSNKKKQIDFKVIKFMESKKIIFRKSKYGESKSSYRPVTDCGDWLDYS